MAFNPAKVQIKQARAVATYDPEAASAAGLYTRNGKVEPTVKTVTALLTHLYPIDVLFLDTDTDQLVFGAAEGDNAVVELVRELETITGCRGWYEKRQLVADTVRQRARSPHAERLLAIPDDLPVADLSPWTSRCEDPEFADEAIRVMVHGYVSRALRPGTKFDLTLIITGPQGVGKTTVLNDLFPGRSVAYRHDDARPVETSATCERIDMEEASEQLFGRDKFNTFKDRVTMTRRGEDVKYVRGKQQMKVRAIFVGSSNERYLMPPGLEGTRRLMVIILDPSDTTLLPTLTDDVWRQLVSEARRRFDAEETPVLSPDGVTRQQAALERVTRPDDDAMLLRDVLNALIDAKGYFQKYELQDHLMDVDPTLAREPAFGRAWRRLRSEYELVAHRVDGRSTRVFVPAKGV